MESTPLVNDEAGRNEYGGINSNATKDPSSDSPRSLAVQLGAELRILSATSLPASLGYMLQNSIQTVSIAIVARNATSDLELSASAHSFMIAMVTAWTIALGGTTALDTLASAAFARSQGDMQSSQSTDEDNYTSAQEVGVLLQRAVCILLCIYLPCAVLWWFSAPLLLGLGQPADVAASVQLFLRWLSLGAPGYILFEAGKKFCLVQGSTAPTVILLIMSPINLLLNIATVRWLGLGMLGSPLAVSVTYYLCAMGVAIHVRTTGRHTLGRAWGGFSWKRVVERQPCIQMCRLALPGILMVGSEWVAFEVVALAAGNLDETSLAAQSVIMTCDQIMNTLPFGLGVAASSRIGNLLGYASIQNEADPARARHSISRLKIASQSAVILATALGVLIASLLMLFRTSFGGLFSNEEATIAKVASVLPLVAAFQIFDGWAAANGGTLRGMGKQHVGAAANLISYYLIALPLGFFLAFRVGSGLGLNGLWIGNALALGLVGAAEWLYVSLVRWDKEVEQARLRA